MIEEEKNEQQPEETEAPDEVQEAEATEAPEAEAEAPGAEMTEAPEAEATEAPEAEPAEAETPAPGEPAVEEPAAEEPAAATPAAEEGGEEAEGETITPKERRKRLRSQHTETRPQRSAEERARERADQRRRKAAERRAWRVRSRERRRGRPDAEPTPAEPKGTGKPKLRQGVVVSDKADKTITVRIDSQRAHRMYGKVVRTSATLRAHDESNDAHVGDTVRVIESRPVSKTKRWRLVEVLERAR